MGRPGLVDLRGKWSKSNYSRMRKVMTTVYEAMESLMMPNLLQRTRADKLVRLTSSQKTAIFVRMRHFVIFRMKNLRIS